MKRLLVVTSIMLPLVLGQVPPATGIRMPSEAAGRPQNLDFHGGAVGTVPNGWFVPAAFLAAGYGAELSSTGCLSEICAIVTAPPAAGPEPKGHPLGSKFGNLMQTFEAKPYRGKTIHLSASLRLDASSHKDTAQMWMRIDCEMERACGFDNMDNHPVRSEQWKKVEIKLRVPESAVKINIGLMSLGHGRAWIDEIKLEGLSK